jgi:murein DD-endopeptidase MepM/ murein hydrolase activator NlpD
MMNSIRTGLILLLFSLPYWTIAQEKAYPRGYFRNPLNIPMQLVANFGELRANHWHMGLDIRTQQKENLPVHAAAEGYIAKVKIEPGGFGRAIYINHPNGYTTLYAHLNDFFPALEQYVKAEQYKRESWAVELTIPPALFPVDKGSFISYSGNTGGSQGPHVHFEIRDTKTDNCLNPLLFGFPIPDVVPPNISRLVMYDRNKSVYVQSPQAIPRKGLLKVNSNRISFAIGAVDRFSGYTNPNGIYSAQVFMDDVLQSEFVLDGIDYLETRYLNAQIDYRYKTNGGGWLQHLSKMPGDTSDVYTNTASNGVLALQDNEVHQVRIDVRDANGNKSTIAFGVQYVPSYSTTAPAALTKFVPTQVNVYESDALEVFTSENAVYDTVYVTHTVSNTAVGAALSPLHTFCSAAIPTHDSISVRIRPTNLLVDPNNNKFVIKSIAGTKTVVQKATWQNGWLSAKFRQFGSFQVFVDNEPPTVNTPPADLTRATRLTFIPKDNFNTIKSFRVEVDGQWLRFTNDKGIVYSYRFDEKFPLGEHQLKVIVEDIAGNVTTKMWSVRR